MTELLYQTDSYTRGWEARVLRVEGDEAVLDRTACYPGGGGQPADRGLLLWDGGRAQVVGARRDGEDLWHRLEGATPLVWQQVHGELDWERRHALMRAHTALHILCGIMALPHFR